MGLANFLVVAIATVVQLVAGRGRQLEAIEIYGFSYFVLDALLNCGGFQFVG